MLTAGGSFQRPSTIMRRHKDGEEHHHHHDHHAHHTKELFHALDLNGDGTVTGAEVKASMKKSDFHIPQTFVDSVENNAEGGITYDEFLKAAHFAAEHHALHHSVEELTSEHDEEAPKHKAHNHHHAEHSATVHAHHHKAPKEEELLEERREQNEQNPATSAWVTCGGHKAPTCTACVTTNAQGQTVFDHGAEWCNGDCVYHNGQCHTQGTVTVSGVTQGASMGYSTSPKPDILNPNITEKDEKIINDAATDAIREENLEAAEKQRAEEEEAESKKFSWGKFWLIVIISFSVILGICAIVSIVALFVFCFMGTPGPEGKGVDDEGEALAEAQGEGEGAEKAGEEAAGES